MSPLAVAVAGGALAGLGALILVRELLPVAPPDLAQALARLDGRTPRPIALAGRGDDAGTGSRFAGWLAGHLPVPYGPLPVPTAELPLLRQPVEQFLVRKVAWGRSA